MSKRIIDMTEGEVQMLSLTLGSLVIMQELYDELREITPEHARNLITAVMEIRSGARHEGYDEGYRAGVKDGKKKKRFW